MRRPTSSFMARVERILSCIGWARATFSVASVVVPLHVADGGWAALSAEGASINVVGAIHRTAMVAAGVVTSSCVDVHFGRSWPVAVVSGITPGSSNVAIRPSSVLESRRTGASYSFSSTRLTPSSVILRMEVDGCVYFP